MKVKLKDICEPKQWKTIPTSMLLSEGYPVYGANGIIGYYDKYNHDKDTLLVTCRGATCGSLNISKGKSYINGNAMALDNLIDKVNIKYLYYYLKHRGLRDVISGSAQPQIIRSDIEKVEIELKDIENQNKIVHLCERIEALIIKQQQLKKYDTLIKARFVEMFGDTKNNEFGYNLKSLDGVSEELFAGGDKPKTVLEVSNEKHLYPVYANGYENEGLQGYSDVNRVKKDAITISARGTIGYCFIRKANFTPIVRLITIVPNNEVNLYYLKYSIDSIGIKSSGTSQSQLTVPDLKREKILVPPIDLQNQFATFVKHIDKLKFA